MATNQLTNLVEPTGLEHGVDARVNARIEGSARRQKADFCYLITFEPGAAGTMDLPHGLTSQHAHLDGTNDFLRIARGDAGSGFAVETRENAVEMFGAALRRFAAQLFAEGVGARRCVGQTFE